MLLLHLLLQDWLNTHKERKKVLITGQAVVESLLCLSFQREKCEGRIIIALIKSV